MNQSVIKGRHDRRRNGLAKQRRSESRSRAAGEAMSGGSPHNTSHRLLCHRFPVAYYTRDDNQ